MDLKYAYLVWSLIFLVIWSLLYAKRKKERNMMLLISILFALVSGPTQLFYAQDWWRPLTITGTIPSIEDVLMGFAIAGVAATLIPTTKTKKQRIRTSLILLTVFALHILCFYILGINSFYTTGIAIGIPLIWMITKRKDLGKRALKSGILMMLVGTALYLILLQLYPTLIKEFWINDLRWYDTLLLGIPLKEYLWYIAAGAFIAPVAQLLY